MNAEFEQRFSLLSDKRILEEMKSGNIVIDPFDKGSLGTASYDLRLGDWYYRSQGNNGLTIYNPWSEDDVRKFWGEPQEAKPSRDIFKNHLPDGIKEEDKVIIIYPNELLLCHTDEFIGYQKTGTTMMKARSSVGRSGLEVCRCAGWGDVGYINRWTMEIFNSLNLPIPLVAGRRVAQLAFFEVGEILDKDYAVTGKYQTSSNLEDIKNSWSPEQMLPKLWKDREAK